VLLLPLAIAGGCATLEDLFGVTPGAASASTRAAPVPLAERPRQQPIFANHFLLSSPEQSVIGEPQVVYTRAEDTLSDLARAYGLGYDELVAANPGVDPWLPGDGTPVLLPTQFVLPQVPREGIVLNVAAKRLFYFPRTAEGQPRIVKTYPVGIGRVGWETPTGATRVVAKAVDPHWYVPASVRQEHAEQGDPLPAVVPPGPDNPLGNRVLQLDMPGYLIHGTNQPYGVGMRVSHGCVRLYPEDIEFLFELVAIGEPVRIVNEPFLLGHLDGDLYFEAHAPLEDDTVVAEERIEALLLRAAESGHPRLRQADRDHLRALASIANGVTARVATHDSHEVFVRARVVHNTVRVDPGEPSLTEVREMIDAMLREEQEAL
jgi:L,D-transpeptidase ErfK/SrfK